MLDIAPFGATMGTHSTETRNHAMTIITKLEALKADVIATGTKQDGDISGFIFCLRVHGLLASDGMKLGHAMDCFEAFKAGDDMGMILILAHYN